MKKTVKILLIVICAAAILGIFLLKKTAPERDWPTEAAVSNLNDESSRAIVKELFAGNVSRESAEMFFDHVDQINRFLLKEELTGGFEMVPISAPKYDPYALQERWAKEYPDFPGYCCRITAFSLFRDYMNIQPDAAADTNYILMDLLALEEDPSAIPDEEGMNAYRTLYAGIQTENTKDVSVHLAHLQESWKQRGISFNDGNMSLISVVFHDQIDGDMLFIGHTGVLFEYKDGTLYFIEKLAFQEPYQLVKVSSRAALSDYLMAKYDVEFNQPTASPFVLENDQLIEGYRSHSGN